MWKNNDDEERSEAERQTDKQTERQTVVLDGFGAFTLRIFLDAGDSQLNAQQSLGLQQLLVLVRQLIAADHLCTHDHSSNSKAFQIPVVKFFTDDQGWVGKPDTAHITIFGTWKLHGVS